MITVLCWWHIFGRVDTVIFFNEILFRKSLFFNFLPSMARMCGCVYLSNATESTVGLSDTRQSQWKQIQATMVHFNGYTLSRSGCLVPVLLYRYVQFFSRPHSRLVCLWLLKFHPPICALFLYILFLPNFRGLADF